MLYFNPKEAIDKTRRKLPHWTQDGRTYWVTFRQADSLPAEKLKTLRAEKTAWLAHNRQPWTDRQWHEYHRRFDHQLEDWLDAGRGECRLRRPETRTLVERCLRHFEGVRYDLPSWVIMPNHVHLLIRPHGARVLSKLLQAIKGVSARQCNLFLGCSGTFWEDESFDHIVRSQEQFECLLHYIADNPVKAGLQKSEFKLCSPS